MYFISNQLTGIFLGLNIIYTLVVLHLPFPLASVIGEGACKWTRLLSTLYITGQAVWSFFIALYRVLFIKFQNLFKKGIKETTFVFFLSQAGILYIISSSVFLAYYDRGMQYKLCSHHSMKEVQILDVSS